MNVHYLVELSNEERAVVEELVYRGSPRVRKVNRALNLLATDQGRGRGHRSSSGRRNPTVFRTQRNFVEHGLLQSLQEAPRLGAKRKLSEKQELLLITVACSDPSVGRSRWTIELLVDQMVRLIEHEFISDETIRRCLHDKELSHSSIRCGAFPK